MAIVEKKKQIPYRHNRPKRRFAFGVSPVFFA